MTETISIVVLEENGYLVAACLEHDIVAQVASGEDPIAAWCEQYLLGKEVHKHEGIIFPDQVKPAPKYYWNKFEEMRAKRIKSSPTG